MTDNQRILKPASTSDIVESVKGCVVDQTSLRIHGPGKTAYADSSRHLLLDNMTDVVDYPARDMTITVQAGLPVRELTKILAEERQQLPVDVFGHASSVGAAVASDSAGPRQYGYGTLRDYVIGIEAVDGQGRIFHAGGRVVKNVAGYDLCRLLVGSRGMLGVITQVTFKLKPRPEASLFRSFRFTNSEAFRAALDRLNTSSANPVVLDFTCGVAADKDGRNGIEMGEAAEVSNPVFDIHLGVEGSPESCQWQMEQLQQDCVEGRPLVSADDQSDQDGLSQYCRSFGYDWQCPRIRCRPSQVTAVAEQLASAGYSSVGHAGNGVVYIIAMNRGPDVRAVADQLAVSFDAVVSEWDVDHPANGTDPLTRRIRQALDPHSVFHQ